MATPGEILKRRLESTTKPEIEQEATDAALEPTQAQDDSVLPARTVPVVREGSPVARLANRLQAPIPTVEQRPNLLSVAARNVAAGVGDFASGLADTLEWLRNVPGEAAETLLRRAIGEERASQVLPLAREAVDRLSGAALDLTFGQPKSFREGGEVLSGLGTPAPEFQDARSLLDPEYLATTGARTLGYSLPLWLTALFGGSAAGGSNLARSLASGVLSRGVEGALEAGQTYKTALERGWAPGEATSAGGRTFAGNLALTGADAAEYALSFLRLPQPATTIGRAAFGAGRIAGAAGLEALEEGAQEAIQRFALGDPIGFDPEMAEAMALGGLLGGGMAGAGQLLQAIESRVLPGLSEADRQAYEQTKQQAIESGAAPEAAMADALDQLAGTEEGSRAIRQAAAALAEALNADARAASLEAQAAPSEGLVPDIPDALWEFQGRRLTRFDLSRLPVEQQRAIRDALTDEVTSLLDITVAPAAQEYLENRFDERFEPLIQAWEQAGVPNELIADALRRTDDKSLANRQRRLIRQGFVDIPMYRTGWVRVPLRGAAFQSAQRAHIDAGRPQFIDLTGQAAVEEEAPPTPETAENVALEAGETAPEVASAEPVFDGEEGLIDEEEASTQPAMRPRQNADVQAGQVVYDHYGDAVEVIDASDPSLFLVRRVRDGAEYLVGRATVTQQAPQTPQEARVEREGVITPDAPQPPLTGQPTAPQAGSEVPIEVPATPSPEAETLLQEAEATTDRQVLQNIRDLLVSLEGETSDAVRQIDARIHGLSGEDVPAEGSPETSEPSAIPGLVATGSRSTAATERGMEVETEWAIVEASDLVTSHDTNLRVNPAFPQELQPRDRTRAASELQIARIVNTLRPEFLVENPKASEGAPIVGPDMIVESGNARTIALKQAYERNAPTIEGYRRYLIDNADRFGIDPEAIRQAEAPVLVRIRRSDVDRRQFVIEANEGSVAAMSATEQALADAERMSLGLMSLFQVSETGEVATPGNREFIQRFVQEVVSAADRGRILDESGRLSQEGTNRIRHAVFARAYGDARAIALLAESTDSNVRNIVGGMLVAAPRFAALRDAIARGELYDLDPTPAITAALGKLSDLRSQGMDVQLYLDQTALFDDELEPLAKDFLVAFESNKRSRNRIANILLAYADIVESLGNPNQESLFGDLETPEPANILQAAIEKVSEGYDPRTPQASLFEGEPEAGRGAQAPPGGVAREDGGEAPQDPTQRPVSDAIESPQPVRDDTDSPAGIIANFVEQALAAGTSIASSDLFQVAEAAYGGTQAEGAFTPKDAYDAMELGINRFLANAGAMADPTLNLDVALESIEALREAVLEKIPTQTRRTEETDEFQQFSTPPPLAYTAAWVANITPQDVVLEPSAGIGGLAVFGKNAGATVIVNELSPRRSDLLRQMNFDRVFTENAEQLHNILPRDVQPTVVIMNPPFSSTAGRIKGERKSINVTKHLDQALKRLEPGGRLVAIVGRGMRPDAPTFREWWRKTEGEYNVRANIGVSGRNYARYGTQFDNRLLVIDKTGPTTQPVLTGEFENLADVLRALEVIRDVRVPARSAGVEQAPGQPGVQTVPSGRPSPGSSAGGRVAPSSTPALGSDRGEGTTPPPARPEARSAPGGVRREPVPGAPRQSDEASPGTGDLPGGAVGVSGDAALTTDAGSSGAVSRGSDAKRDRGGDAAGEDRGRLTVRRRQDETTDDDLTESIYVQYRPKKVEVEGAKPHPGKLAESAAMAAVDPPDATYTPNLPKEIVEKGLLSDAQLEAVVYAGQAHSQMLPDGMRRGFFIGDGTGVGKGREISAIILDNMRQGRKKAVWISKNMDLLADARRDWGNIGQDPKIIIPYNKVRAGEIPKQKEGILFTTYATLGQGSTVTEKGEIRQGKGEKTSRLDALVEWLGEDFDGVIAFDEAHEMKSALPSGEGIAKKKPALKAAAGVELQKRLPNARIVYVSATGATEVENLAYAERLGLWGQGTAFADKLDFINRISASGIAALELVARDMKAQGSYVARSLSYDGVSYGTLEHTLTPEQVEMYDVMARAWQIVLQNIHKALEVTEAGKDSRARSRAQSLFWSAHQRFFNQVITSMQMPSVIEAIQRDLDEGRAAVLQLVNTNEAAQNRALAERAEDETLEELDLTPRQTLAMFLEKAFPIYQYQEVMDENGRRYAELVTDSAGNPVINQDALALRDELLDQIGAIRIPEGPLEILLNTFGTKMVAEVTGRTQRVVRDPETGETVVENRSPRHRERDTDAFMADEKRILVFSNAGGTGRSYHADLSAKNQRKRTHYLIQPGWIAENAVQGFGRTHRTNQAQPPHYVLVTTNLLGQKRFISSIARRLDQLGALTRGQRQTGGQGIFSERDNLESPLAAQALERFFRDLAKGEVDVGVDGAELLEKMGLGQLIDEYGQIRESTDLRDMPRFLNRVLSLEVDLQNRVFDAYMQRLDEAIAQAEAEGTLDRGMENFRADSIEVASEKMVHRTPAGAETYYLQIRAGHRINPMTFDAAAKAVAAGKGFFIRNERSGRVYGLVRAGTRTDQSGRVITLYRRLRPDGLRDYVDETEIRSSPNIERLSVEAARSAWDAEVAKLPEFRYEPIHVISGALLPIWDRLPDERARVYRMRTNDGRVILGRVISPQRINSILENLGAEAGSQEISTANAIDLILDEGYTARLANGWRIMRRRVSGEYRIEIEGGNLLTFSEQLKGQGVFTERIQYKTRFFIPTGSRSQEVFDAVTQNRPIVEMIPPGGSGSRDGGRGYPSPPKPSAARGPRAQQETRQAPTDQGPRAASGVRGFPQGAPTDTASPSTPIAPKGALVTKAEIVDYIEKELLVPIREGRLTLRRALGEYKARPGVIRLKKPFNLPIIAHEFGHHLVQALNIEPAQYPEVQGLGAALYPDAPESQQLEEGLAEFFRLYFTEPETAKQAAPGFFRRFESELGPGSRLWSAIKELQRLYLEYYRQSPVEKVGAHIARQPPKETPFLTGGERFYTMAVDDLYPIWKALQIAAGEEAPSRVIGDISPEFHAYMLAGLARGRTRGAHQMLTRRQFNPDFETVGEGLAQILEPVRDRIDDFEIYLVARRAAELHERGIKSGIEQEDVEGALQELENPLFQEVAEKIYAYQDNLVDHLIDAGLMSEADAEVMREHNRSYVPFYRFFGEEAATGSGVHMRRGWTNQTNPVRRIKGSERPIISPLESIIRNTFMYMDVAAKNRVAQAFFDAADHSPQQLGRFVEKLPVQFEARTVELAQLKTDLIDAGVPAEMLEDADLERMAVVFNPLRFARFKEAKENIVTVYRNGKPTFYQVHPEIYRSLQFLDQEPGNWLVKLLSYPTRLLRAGATLDPAFATRNPVRDMFSSFVQSKYGIVPVVDFVRGLLEVVNKGELYNQIEAAGGLNSTLVRLDTDYLQGQLRQILGTETPRERWVRRIRSPLTALEMIGQTLEEATRLGEARRAIEREGRTREGILRTAYAAREVSIDFQRAGTIGREANRVKAFFNASIQGIDKLTRVWREDPVGATIRSLVSVTLPSIVLWLLNKDDPRYQELPQWRKDLFWTIIAGDTMIHIPKPFEIGVLFGAVPERILQWIYDQDPSAFDGLLDSIIEVGLPVDPRSTVDFLPDAFLPIVEVYANRRVLGDRPIVPASEQNLLPKHQYGPRTTETAKAIGAVFNVSPRYVEHLIRGYGGGLASSSLVLLDILTGNPPPREVFDPFGGDPYITPESVEQFYREFEQLEQKYRSARSGRGTITPEELQRWAILSEYEELMSRVRQARRTIEADPGLPREAKDERIKELNITTINLARRALGKPPIEE